MVGTIARYYLYRATLSSGFYLPVSVIYMQSHALGLAEIGFVQATFLFTMVLAEIPTGYVGDRLGHRTALALGSVLSATVMVGFTLASTTAHFAVIYATWAIAWTFKSGTVDAWLYEYLDTIDREDDFAGISGTSNAALQAVSAATALLAGLLYVVDPAAPFLANGVLATIGLPIVATLPATDGTGDTEDTLGVRAAIRVITEELPRPRLRWLVAYAAIFNLVYSVTRVFEQPAMQSVGVSVAALGGTYAGFKLLEAIAATQVGTIEDALGTRGVLLAQIPVVGLTYAAFGALPALVVPALFLRRGVQRITRPVRTGYINDQVAGTGRATVLSGVSMVLTLISGTGNILGGYVAAAIGPVTF
ncbi:MAG: MFS transporter, partial [Halodesulfurarchaeum sp.]